MTNPFQTSGPGFGTGQGGSDVNRLHDQDDRDISPLSHHHTLGIFPAQAAPGDHNHDGKQSKTLLYSNLVGIPAIPVPALTVASEVPYAIVPAVGVSAKYAREDHTHGTPVKPVAMFDLAASANLVPTVAVQDVPGLTTPITTTKATAFIIVTVFLDCQPGATPANTIITGNLVINGVAQAGQVVYDGVTANDRDTVGQTWAKVVGITAGVIVKITAQKNVASTSLITQVNSRMTVLVCDV